MPPLAGLSGDLFISAPTSHGDAVGHKITPLPGLFSTAYVNPGMFC